MYPKEIESVIDELPGVQECAVIGVPHADFGEAVVAVVVPDKDDLSWRMLNQKLQAALQNLNSQGSC